LAFSQIHREQAQSQSQAADEVSDRGRGELADDEAADGRVQIASHAAQCWATCDFSVTSERTLPWLVDTLWDAALVALPCGAAITCISNTAYPRCRVSRLDVWKTAPLLVIWRGLVAHRKVGHYHVSASVLAATLGWFASRRAARRWGKVDFLDSFTRRHTLGRGLFRF
jgi:hypothetical protein